MSMKIRKKHQALYEQAIALHQQYGYGSLKLSHIIPVNDRTIRRWLTNFAQEQQGVVMPKKRAKSQAIAPSNTSRARFEARIAELEAENNQLKRQYAHVQAQNTKLEKDLKFEHVRATAFEHMIELAESSGMPVRKNSGTKQ